MTIYKTLTELLGEQEEYKMEVTIKPISYSQGKIIHSCLIHMTPIEDAVETVQSANAKAKGIEKIIRNQTGLESDFKNKRDTAQQDLDQALERHTYRLRFTEQLPKADLTISYTDHEGTLCIKERPDEIPNICITEVACSYITSLSARNMSSK